MYRCSCVAFNGFDFPERQIQCIGSKEKSLAQPQQIYKFSLSCISVEDQGSETVVLLQRVITHAMDQGSILRPAICCKYAISLCKSASGSTVSENPGIFACGQ